MVGFKFSNIKNETFQREEEQIGRFEKIISSERKKTESFRNDLLKEIRAADDLIRLLEKTSAELERAESLIDEQNKIAEKLLRLQVVNPTDSSISDLISQYFMMDKELQNLFELINHGLAVMYNIERQFNLDEKLEESFIKQFVGELKEIHAKFNVLQNVQQTHKQTVEMFKKTWSSRPRQVVKGFQR